MKVPVESIKYLLDVFIESGYYEDEDEDHVDAIDAWLKHEQQERFLAFEKRTRRERGEKHPGCTVPAVTATLEWNAEVRPWVDPCATNYVPTDYPLSEEDEDE